MLGTKLLIYWDFNVQPTLEFLQNELKERKQLSSSSRLEKKKEKKEKDLMRDLSEVRGEWPVDTEVAQTQITTFVRASVASDPETRWALRRWRTAAGINQEPQTVATCCKGFKQPLEPRCCCEISTVVSLLALNDERCISAEAQMNIVTSLVYFFFTATVVKVSLQSPGSTSARQTSGCGWTGNCVNTKLEEEIKQYLDSQLFSSQ